MKANMMIIRGSGAEYAGESWSLLERRAYMKLPPKRVGKRMEAVFDLVLLVPGREPVKCEVCFYRGCNALAIPNSVVGLIPPEFADPIEAIDYAARNGLDVPPVLPGIFDGDVRTLRGVL